MTRSVFVIAGTLMDWCSDLHLTSGMRFSRVYETENSIDSVGSDHINKVLQRPAQDGCRSEQQWRAFVIPEGPPLLGAIAAHYKFCGFVSELLRAGHRSLPLS